MKIETGYSRGKLNAICITPENYEEEAFLERTHDVKPQITITYSIGKSKKTAANRKK